MIAGKTFLYNDRLYLSMVPVKSLLRSTTIYEIVTRGDVFALDMETFQFTVVPGTAEVTLVEEYRL